MWILIITALGLILLLSSIYWIKPTTLTRELHFYWAVQDGKYCHVASNLNTLFSLDKKYNYFCFSTKAKFNEATCIKVARLVQYLEDYNDVDVESIRTRFNYLKTIS